MLRLSDLRRDDGAAATEYALVLLGLIVGSIALIFAFRTVALGVYVDTCSKVGTDGIVGAPTACP